MNALSSLIVIDNFKFHRIDIFAVKATRDYRRAKVDGIFRLTIVPAGTYNRRYRATRIPRGPGAENVLIDVSDARKAPQPLVSR